MSEVGGLSHEAPIGVGARLHKPLTKIQAVVGLGAGLLTIAGGAVSLTGFTVQLPSKGEVVAVVQDAARNPVPDATVEILTRQDALVTTITAERDGRVMHRVKEGQYRVRVTHPQFATQVRQVEVHAGERSEIRLLLTRRPPAPTVTTVTARPGPVRRFFKDLGL